MIISKISNKQILENFVKFSILLLEIVRVLAGLATIASKYECSNPCCFGDMTFFRVFFLSFSKNLDIEKLTKFEVLISIVRLSGYHQEFQFFPPNVTAQIRVLFEI